MNIITGVAGAVSIASGAVNGKVTQWRTVAKSDNLTSKGMGDTHVERTHLFLDWEAEIEFNAADQATWDLNQGLVGTSAAVALKRKTSDSNPYATGTGLVTEAEVTHNVDQPTKVRIKVECNGTALTLDTSPAS